MQKTFMGRLSHAWNVFRSREPTEYQPVDGNGYSSRPDKSQNYYRSSEGEIITPILNRIALDVASVNFKHVRLGDNEQYEKTIYSSINNLLTLEANIDQTGRQFIQDMVHSACDEGYVAAVPTETDMNPDKYGGFDIYNARVGRILEWYPKEVLVDLYNDETGEHEEVYVKKDFTVIIENPLYAVMNESNSTLKRLMDKIRLLDESDAQITSTKLDLIIQLPYVLKSEKKKEEAAKRKADLIDQLYNSPYGIAYTDGTEKITQLNRSVENNLSEQVDTLMGMIYNQLGLTKGIFDGTATEDETNHYFNTTIEPWCNAIVDEMRRKWLTKTARTQKQSIIYFRDMFKLIPISELAELIDKLTRNEILSSNEVRSIMGYMPSSDPKANELRNKNLNQSNQVDNDQVIDEEVAKRLDKKLKDKNKKDKKGEPNGEN